MTGHFKMFGQKLKEGMEDRFSARMKEKPYLMATMLDPLTVACLEFDQENVGKLKNITDTCERVIIRISKKKNAT